MRSQVTAVNPRKIEQVRRGRFTRTVEHRSSIVRRHIPASAQLSGKIVRLERSQNIATRSAATAVRSPMWRTELELPITEHSFVKRDKFTRSAVIRTEELVWRSHSKTSRNAREFSQLAEIGSAIAVQSATVHDRYTAETASRAAAEDEPIPSITKLDPTIVDRLTDDVIRKMERRVRIERERRGL